MKHFVKKISLPQLILEFVSVVFAVLLALGLNSYKQSRDKEADASMLKAAILVECQNNLMKVDSILIKNESYFNYLDSLVSLDPVEVDNVMLRYDFDLLIDAAWQITQNNTASNQIDSEFLLEAAEIYQTQLFLSKFASDFFSNLGAHIQKQDEVPPYNTALSLYFNIGIMVNSSKELQEAYQAFLAKYTDS